MSALIQICTFSLHLIQSLILLFCLQCQINYFASFVRKLLFTLYGGFVLAQCVCVPPSASLLEFGQDIKILQRSHFNVVYKVNLILFKTHNIRNSRYFYFQKNGLKLVDTEVILPNSLAFQRAKNQLNSTRNQRPPSSASYTIAFHDFHCLSFHSCTFSQWNRCPRWLHQSEKF